MLFVLFFEVNAVVTENVCCCRQEHTCSCQQDVQCCLPIASSCSVRNFQGTRGGSDTGINIAGLASLPASLSHSTPVLRTWSYACTSGMGGIGPDDFKI